MRAVTWQGHEKVAVETVPDPVIVEPTDAVVRITSTAICGSDLHLYSALGAFLRPGDVLGHEGMGIVEEVGPEAGRLRPGDRVVVPFTISCGACWMCRRGLFAQCERTQVVAHGTGAALFGYTTLYGAVPGAQAEYLRVPQAQFGPITIESDLPDEHFLYLSDILPTAYQALEYADLPDGGTLAVFGLGPVGQLVTRLAIRRGLRTVAVEPVADRRSAVEALGVQTIDPDAVDDVVPALWELTDGRGPDAVVDAVGMESAGSPVPAFLTAVADRLPGALTRPLLTHAGIDRLAALHAAVRAVRRGGVVSIAGVYGGAVDPMPLREMVDRGITLRMGQCHVRRWTDDLLPLSLDLADPLGLANLATHRLPLEQAADGYRIFQHKQDGCRKVVLRPADTARST